MAAVGRGLALCLQQQKRNVLVKICFLAGFFLVFAIKQFYLIFIEDWMESEGWSSSQSVLP